MSALEQEWMDQFKNLNETQRREVLDFARKLAEKKEERSAKLGAALELARQELEKDRVKYGENHFDSAAMLRELREEESE
jgi:hypothetical protein